jgi:hypothetical protein
VAQAYYPDSIYVILAPQAAAGEWRGRAFRIEAGAVQEVEVMIVNESAGN